MLISSLVFYAFAGIEHALLLLLEIIWVYVITSSPYFKQKASLFYLTIIPLFLGLFYYKYIGFFITSVIGLEPSVGEGDFIFLRDIILPAGISFFTFQLASYAIDCRRGEITQRPVFSHFAAYISFFPQLVAGPILRYRDVAARLLHIENFKIKEDDVARAIGYIVVGLALKVILADTLNHNIEGFKATTDALSQSAALYTILAYSFQIYFDFYGYSMVAIGLGCLFGFTFPHNFKRPYESNNPRIFWRRWHITLSFWIRDYLYIAIGGNKKYLRNMIIVMAICGLWHGAGWTFIVWGLYHAALVIFYHFTKEYWDQLSELVQKIATFSLVSYGWLLFLFDFDQFIEVNHALVFGNLYNPSDFNLEMISTIFLSFLVCFFAPIEKIAENQAKSQSTRLLNSALLSVLFIVTLFLLDRSQGFIYFRF